MGCQQSWNRCQLLLRISISEWRDRCGCTTRVCTVHRQCDGRLCVSGLQERGSTLRVEYGNESPHSVGCGTSRKQCGSRSGGWPMVAARKRNRCNELDR